MEEVSSWYVKERDPFYIIGITDEKLSNAKKMKKEGLPIPLIAKITGLNQEEILHLKTN